MKKKLFLTLVLVLFQVLLPTSLFAGRVDVSYPSYPAPLFSESNLAPGAIITRIVTLKNSSDSNQAFRFKIDPVSGGLLSSGVKIKVSNVSTGEIKYSGPLSNIFKVGEINLDILPPNTSADYSFAAELDSAIGNEFQNLSENFNMIVGFDATSAPQEQSFLGGVVNRLGFTSDSSGRRDSEKDVLGLQTEASQKSVDQNSKDASALWIYGTFLGMKRWVWLMVLIFCCDLFLYLNKKTRNRVTKE